MLNRGVVIALSSTGAISGYSVFSRFPNLSEEIEAKDNGKGMFAYSIFFSISFFSTRSWYQWSS